MQKVIRFADKNDMMLLKEMYLNDVENHEQRAIEFAKDLIFRLNTLLCAVDLKIIGTVSWDTRGGLNDGVIELIGLGITQNYRRQGIARELVLTLISETKNFFKSKGYKLRVIYFFMERSNNTARKFYNAMGFREVSIIPAFYPNDDAVIWIKYF